MWPMLGWFSEARDLSFAFKASQAIRIVREGLRQDFQRHVPIELGVSRSIHLPHAAFADLGGDGIGARGSCRVQEA